MSEGNVYPVRWKAFDLGFDVWINRRATIRARGSTLEEALEELSGVVCLATCDGEAVFQLDPPASGNPSADHSVTLSSKGAGHTVHDRFNRPMTLASGTIRTKRPDLAAAVIGLPAK